jgi:hypothetical protein
MVQQHETGGPDKVVVPFDLAGAGTGAEA